MNEKYLWELWAKCRHPHLEYGGGDMVWPMEFAELIVRECVAQCEQVATDADTMTKSKFVTDAGRQLHQGMWGGAKNCSSQIKEHFGVY